MHFVFLFLNKKDKKTGGERERENVKSVGMNWIETGKTETGEREREREREKRGAERQPRRTLASYWETEPSSWPAMMYLFM